MARPIINDPLEGRSPGIQPTARPLSVAIGATPAPSRSPLMELGEAFREFNPALRGLLRDAAAKADNDAMALGEIEATRTQAAKRMGEIEKVLKEQVDAGKLDAVRLPAFERGFRLRAGKELAQSVFQEKLTSRLSEATRVDNRVDPEQIIGEAYADVSKAIGPTDLYAKAGFEEIAQGVIAGFRQRAAEGYTAEYRRVALEKIADEGSELAYRLATADDENVSATKDAIRAHLDSLRKELPTSQVNGFYIEQVLVPAIRKLRYEHKITEAQQLLDEAEGLDVTGTGGLLGKTATARSQFSSLRAELDNAGRTELNRKYDELQTEAAIKNLGGKNAAAAQLQKLRLDNAGKLPREARFNMIEQFRKENAGDALLVAGFAEAVNQEFEHDERYSTNPKTEADLVNKVNTLSKTQLDAAEAEARVAAEAGEIRWSVQAQLQEAIGKRRALFGFIDEQDTNRFKKDVFYVRGLGGLGTTINVGDTTSADMWDKLSLSEDGLRLRDEIELSTTTYFNQQLEAFIVSESGGDPAKAPAVKAMALDKATIKAREFAKSAILGAKKRETEAKAKVQAEAQAVAVAQAKSTERWAKSPFRQEARMTTNAIDFRGVPGVDVEKSLKDLNADYHKPSAERDFAVIPFRAKGVYYLIPAIKDRRFVSLPQLADEAKVKPGGEASELYAIGKARLGFTPDEIKARVTKHGVAFNPAAIDPKAIPVFRTVSELNANWNNGEFTPLFGEIGDLIDPENSITPEEFYKAQMALLSTRK